MKAGLGNAGLGSTGLRDVALLVNPHAGGGRGLRTGRSVATELRRRGVGVTWLVGDDVASARGLAREAVAGGCGALVACGGDGTVHVALQAIALTGVPLGVIPCGTGNDLARALGVPLDDLFGAVHLLCAAAPRPVDLGLVTHGAEDDPRDGVWFGTVLAAGFDSRVNDRVNRWGWPPGRSRYNLAIAAELAMFRPIPFVLTVDGERRAVEAMLVAVGNGSSYGGGMRICPDAQLDDGCFDVTVVTRVSRALLVRLLPSVYSGRHVQRPEVLTFRASSIGVAAPSVTGYADGERVAALPVRCRAVRGAALAFTPAPRGTRGGTLGARAAGRTPDHT